MASHSASGSCPAPASVDGMGVELGLRSRFFGGILDAMSTYGVNVFATQQPPVGRESWNTRRRPCGEFQGSGTAGAGPRHSGGAAVVIDIHHSLPLHSRRFHSSTPQSSTHFGNPTNPIHYTRGHN